MKSLFSYQELEKIKSIIVNAGENILEKNEHKILAAKDMGSVAGNIVTQTDIDTEDFLRDKLASLFPHIGFYSEESYKTSAQELEKELCWVVDPIDGTLNFSRGLPIYGISVGLLHKGKPVVGFIYWPRFNQLYYGEVGQGAFLGKQNLSISQRPLQGSYGAAYFGDWSQQELEGIRQFIKSQKMAVTNYMSSVFHLSHTAAGELDFSIHINTSLWDMAAGWAIIEAAGGVVEIIHEENIIKKNGNPYYLWVIAGNKHIVEAWGSEIKKVTKAY